MAQLHRRVRRLSYRVLGLVAALGAHAAHTAPLARAQAAPTQLESTTAPTLAELAELGSALGSADVATRRRAHDGLLALGDDALPAIQARLSELATRIDAEAALSAISAFRRVQGATDPTSPVNLLKGVWPTLEKDRGRATLIAAELVLLLRALEAQKSPAAAQVIVGQLFALAPKLFRYEAQRTRERLGVVMLPAFVRHRNHVRPFIRGLCNDALIEMHMDSPGRAVQQDDVVLLSALIAAYGDTLTFDAMPVIVSYLTDERVAVREAATKAIKRFGKNAIWQLRERYLNSTGREADPSWGHQRLLDDLQAMHDAPRRQNFERDLTLATKALDAGEQQAAADALSRALDAVPQSSHAKLAAPLYTRLAATYFEQGELEAALGAYRRALRLAPDAEESANLEARVRYLEAELRLDQGIVDLPGYRKAMSLDPGFGAAAETYDVVSGDKAGRERMWRRVVGFFAALLMLVAAFALLRSARLQAKQTAPVSDTERPPEHPAEGGLS